MRGPGRAQSAPVGDRGVVGAAVVDAATVGGAQADPLPLAARERRSRLRIWFPFLRRGSMQTARTMSVRKTAKYKSKNAVSTTVNAQDCQVQTQKRSVHNG